MVLGEVPRPGVILGPGEYVGRLPCWLNRARKVAGCSPYSGGCCIQPEDVRDIAGSALVQAEAPGGRPPSGALGRRHIRGIHVGRTSEHPHSFSPTNLSIAQYA
ncbi:hypothetical protein JCM4914_69080 [Streptomyces platensis subsp. malvinus]